MLQDWQVGVKGIDADTPFDHSRRVLLGEPIVDSLQITKREEPGSSAPGFLFPKALPRSELLVAVDG